eukprot:COSAG05_NODE_32_length_28165_cov_450.666714_25_plen_70_part_00
MRGIMLLRFDNTFSWLRRKLVRASAFLHSFLSLHLSLLHFESAMSMDSCSTYAPILVFNQYLVTWLFFT